MNAATTMTSMLASAPMAPAVPANVQVTLALALILFAIGLVGFLTRRNMILMFLSTELMFQAAALAFVVPARQTALIFTHPRAHHLAHRTADTQQRRPQGAHKS